MDVDMCRTCLRRSSDLYPLFQDAELPQKIKTITSVEVSNGDNLPDKVCAECIVNINLSYNFRRVVIHSDSKLRDAYACSLIKQTQEEVNNTKDIVETCSLECEDLKSNDDHSDSKLQDAYVCSSIKQTQKEVNDTEDNVETYILQYEDLKSNVDNENAQFLAIALRDGDDIEIELGEGLNIVEENADGSEEDDNTKDESGDEANFKKWASLKDKLYKCDKCDFESTIYRKFKNHQQNHAMKVCTVCGKFVSAANMRKHTSIHTDQPIQCAICGKMCKNSESLRGHILIHTGINRKCKFCGETFTERAVYVAHLKTHKGNEDKRVTCPLCKKLLYGKYGLKKHIRSHTGERPFPCEICNKGFSSTHALKTHIRQHTQEKPYKCLLCAMAFPQKVSLRTHLKSKHNAEYN